MASAGGRISFLFSLESDFLIFLNFIYYLSLFHDCSSLKEGITWTVGNGCQDWNQIWPRYIYMCNFAAPQFLYLHFFLSTLLILNFVLRLGYFPKEPDSNIPYNNCLTIIITDCIFKTSLNKLILNIKLTFGRKVLLLSLSPLK